MNDPSNTGGQGDSMILWAETGGKRRRNRAQGNGGRRCSRSRVAKSEIGLMQVAAGNQRYGTKDPEAYPMGAFIAARRQVERELRLGVILDSFPKYPKGQVGPCLAHDFLHFRAVLVADNEAGVQWHSGVLQHSLAFRLWFDPRRGEIRSRMWGNQCLSIQGEERIRSEARQDGFPAVVFQVDTEGSGVVEVSAQAQLRDGRGRVLKKSPAVRRLVSYQDGAFPTEGPDFALPPKLDVSEAW